MCSDDEAQGMARDTEWESHARVKIREKETREKSDIGGNTQEAEAEGLRVHSSLDDTVTPCLIKGRQND